jgi:hypothetical protein
MRICIAYHYMRIHILLVDLQLEEEFEVEVENESAPTSETSPTEVVSEGPPEGAPIGFAANCNILVEEPDSPPHQGKPRCICHLLVVFKLLSLICRIR